MIELVSTTPSIACTACTYPTGSVVAMQNTGTAFLKGEPRLLRMDLELSPRIDALVASADRVMYSTTVIAVESAGVNKNPKLGALLF